MVVGIEFWALQHQNLCVILSISVPPGDGSQGTVLVLGAGFAGEMPAVQVKVNNSTCHIVALNQTQVVCQMKRLPAGVYQVTVLVRPYGFALNGSRGEGIFLRVEPKLVAIEPPTAPETGRSE